MKALFEYIDKIPKKIIPAFSILLIILLGFIDVITGYEVSFSIFYLLPVMIVSWYSQKYYAVISRKREYFYIFGVCNSGDIERMLKGKYLPGMKTTITGNNVEQITFNLGS